VLLSSGDNFPHLIQKHRSQLGFVTYLLNYPRIMLDYNLYQMVVLESYSSSLIKMLSLISGFRHDAN